MGVIYYQRAGGQVIAALKKADAEYERQLDRDGVNWQALLVPDAQLPDAAEIARAVVSGGKVEVRG